MVPGAGRHQLSKAIDAVEPQPNSVVVAELLAARERLDAKVCAALSGFLARDLHQVEGWSSPVGWLRAHGLSDPDAKRLAVRSLRLAAWPELAGLCATHHGVIHRHEWALELEPDGTLEFRRPDGHTITSPPPRRHRPPPLPLHHPKIRGLIPQFADRAPPEAPVGHPEPAAARNAGPGPREPDEPTEHGTDLMVRARVVDLVHRHHRPRRRPPTDQPIDPDAWPEAA